MSFTWEELQAKMSGARKTVPAVEPVLNGAAKAVDPFTLPESKPETSSLAVEDPDPWQDGQEEEVEELPEEVVEEIEETIAEVVEFKPAEVVTKLEIVDTVPQYSDGYTNDVQEGLLQLLEACLIQVVDDPTDFELEVTQSSSVILLTVLSRDVAMGKLLGKGGSYASAVRNLCRAWWGKYKIRAEYSVNLLKEQ